MKLLMAGRHRLLLYSKSIKDSLFIPLIYISYKIVDVLSISCVALSSILMPRALHVKLQVLALILRQMIRYVVGFNLFMASTIMFMDCICSSCDASFFLPMQTIGEALKSARGHVMKALSDLI